MSGEIAPRGILPPKAKVYRTIGPFDAQTLPKGLRGEHSLKPGAWARLDLTRGSLEFVWDDAKGGKTPIAAPARLIVPPTVPHHVEGPGPFELTITFFAT